MQMTRLITLILLLFTLILSAQKKVETHKLFSAYATKAARINYRQTLSKKAQLLFAGKIQNEKSKIAILDEMALMFYRPKGTYKYIYNSLSDFRMNSVKFNNHLLEALKALFPDSANALVKNIITEMKVPSTFIYGACTLMHYPERRELSFVDSVLNEKFSGSKDLRINLFKQEINSRQKSVKTKLAEILSAPFQKGKTIIFSFQRYDRSFPGLTIIRKPDGNFVREENGEIFSIPQLALSAANLPAYLKDGNTPQGIFSIVGFYITQKKSIGPTPIVLTRIPFGKPPKIFFHGQNKFRRWNIADYKALVPSAFKNYAPFYEAFYAGKLGRRLLVMHGSTDDLNFYKNEKYHPLTPTRGCLSATEIWDEKGKVIKSDQAKLINAFFSTKKLEGFLIVLNIDDAKKPVTLDELLPYIKKTERITKSRKPEATTEPTIK